MSGPDCLIHDWLRKDEVDGRKSFYAENFTFNTKKMRRYYKIVRDDKCILGNLKLRKKLRYFWVPHYVPILYTSLFLNLDISAHEYIRLDTAHECTFGYDMDWMG